MGPSLKCASNFYSNGNKFMKKYRWGVAGVWVVLACAGLYVCPIVLRSTNTTFRPIPGSPAKEAQDVIVPLFPLYYSEFREILAFSSKIKGASLVDGPVADKLFDVTKDLAANVKRGFSEVSRSTSFYELDRTFDVQLMARSLITPNNGTILFAVSYEEFKYDYHMMEFADYLEKESKTLINQYGLQNDISVHITGAASVSRDMSTSSKEDIEKMDTRIMPIAFLVLAFVIRSLPLMLIPALAIPISLMAQFLCLYPFSLFMEIVSYAPSIMMSLTLALGIDYSLFMLTRFMDGFELNHSIDDCISLMYRSAGRVIIVSCLTLFTTLAGQLMFPMGMIRSMVVGSLISIMISLLVNLTLVPSLLHILGPCLMRLHTRFSLSKCKDKVRSTLSSGAKKSEQADPDIKLPNAEGNGTGKAQMKGDEERKDNEQALTLVIPPAANGSLSPVSPRSDSERDLDTYDPRVKAKGIWFAIARFVSRPKSAALILLAVLVLIAPVAYHIKDLHYSMSMTLIIPRASPSREGFDMLLQEYGGLGPVSPYNFVLQAKSNAYPNGLVNEEAFTAMQSVVRSIMSVGMTGLKDFQAPVVLDGQFISWETWQSATTPGSPQYNDQIPKTLRVLDLLFFSQNKGAMLLLFLAPFEPLGQPGRKWLYEVRKVMAQEGPKLGFDVYLEGVAASCIDSVDGVFRAFKIAAPLMLAVAFLIIAVFFKSLIAPARSILTLILTLLFVYGFAVLVYEKGIMSSLHFHALGNTGALMWFVVFMAFSMITGLSLDYDVFLTTRILEFREEGYSERSSVIRGVLSTGSTITFAGIIMAIAFGGLLFSSSMLLNQLALMLVTAVLLDTFIIRSLVVPSLVTLSGKYVWWPRKDLPEVTKICKVSQSVGSS